MTLERLPGVADVTVERDVPCRLRDGVVLYADVYRPAGDGPWPVLLTRLPYDKRSAQSNSGYAHPSWYARHGYLVVTQDVRGCWSSQGELEPFVHEAEDGYDTIEWAARLPGADGRVGTYGFSYPGISQLLAATLRPPSLVTMCPGFTGSQAYDGWTYTGGAFGLAFAASWAIGLALDTARRRDDDVAVERLVDAAARVGDGYRRLPLVEHDVLSEGDAPYYREWLDHPCDDDYWRRFAIDADYSRITVPALHVGGWWDVFLTGTIRNFEGLTAAGHAPQKLLVGPWAHSHWQPVGTQDPAAGTRVVDDWHLRWFDHLLRGCETGVLEAPATVYVVGDGWRDLDGWPGRAGGASWYLHSGGRANSATGDGALSVDEPAEEPPDLFLYDPAYPTPSLGGHSCCDEASAPMGPACQAAAEGLKSVLVYTSQPLEHDLELIGDAEVTLYAATTALDTDLAARLCLVDEGGVSRNVLEGILRLRYRDSFTAPSLLEPGRVYELTIRLGALGLRVPAGTRLRLDVSGSDFPQWDRNLNTGGDNARTPLSAAVVATQTVLHDAGHPSRLVLPVAP
jgi:hypothetical protein